MLTCRWESDLRWYEAELVCDLFGDWLIVRRWGGLYNARHGTQTEVVPDLLSGVCAVFAIDRERRRRKPPYARMKFGATATGYLPTENPTAGPRGF